MITHNNIGYSGRFGNQLFQFASTVGIARKNNYEVQFPIKNIYEGKKQRLNNNQEFVAKLDLTSYFDIDEKFFSNDIIINRSVNEVSFNFNSNLFRVADFTNIDGYLQSEQYFSHCSDEIKEILKIQPHFIEEAKKLLPKTDKNLVGIHIRRCDYISSDNNHPFIGVEYINRGIEALNDKNNHYIVCSDDYKWCEEQWGDNKNFTIIKSNSQFIDFTILTMCNDFIISNSSFSWWASYLSKNKEKKVIAPSNWFSGVLSKNNTKDLYRKDMIIL